MLPCNLALGAQGQSGSIRGVVSDRDFDVPLQAAKVTIVETGQAVESGDQGNYRLSDVPPGTYTVVFSKEGYVRGIRPNVVVAAGRLTDLDAALSGDFTEMDEFIVEDILQMAAGSEVALLQLRIDSPALMDSISSELMSRAGASDAASALRLISGASVQDGKFAVIRGLPDRYVSSQMNGVRLPTADEDKRAVELDQFPAVVIDSIQVSKTFTPDQQGDASGGAVDVRLKGIPDDNLVQLRGQATFNSQVRGRDDFLSYEDGGVSFWGRSEGDRRIQELGESWSGAVGPMRTDAPDLDYKASTAFGGNHVFDNGVKVGGFASFFYERATAYYDDGQSNALWVETPGEGLVPEKKQQTASDEFATALFDVDQGAEAVQLGALGVLGMEIEGHSLDLTYLYSRTADDKATLAEDTRGKEYFFPGYDPNDPFGPGNGKDERDFAPYIRFETLEYTERTTGTLQLAGSHPLPIEDFGFENVLEFGAPELDWTVARSSATLDQPDKRLFGTKWWARSYDPGVPPFTDPSVKPAKNLPFRPDANINLGNLQRIFKTIEEDSELYALNLRFPFQQWTDSSGYFKFGIFDDSLNREFTQDGFNNGGELGADYESPFQKPWSSVWPDQEHPIDESLYDVDYRGDQDISATYAMVDLPLFEGLNLVGGARFESTEMSIVNDPEELALWFPPGAPGPEVLDPGEANASISQNDVLPSIGLVATPVGQVKLRASYAETIARPTFKELTPVIQQEFLGAPIFIGNPDVQLSSIKNYDLRADYTPYEGGLISASWFYKDLEDPIENVQRVQPFSFTSVTNYPEGEISGLEFELRQDLDRVWEPLGGFSIGANATFIDSEVTLPEDEAAQFELPNIAAPITTRDATNAPDYLYNLYLNYEVPGIDALLTIFYTVQGDTLIAGAGTSGGNFVPSVYETKFGTLNMSLIVPLTESIGVKAQAKNITNPDITTVYRSEYTGEDAVRTSFSRGVEYSLSLAAEIPF